MIQGRQLTTFYKLTGLLILILAVKCQVPCQQFSQLRCIRCPVGSHLYQQLCYQDIIGCQQYANGTQCTQCDSSIATLRNGTCVLINPLSAGQLRLRTNVGDQYGSPEFILISLQEALNDPNFNKVDRYMRTSQYSFRISQVANPIVSVHTYISNQNVYNYKILYQGAGGGLFLCIISINSGTDFVTLSSFVLIGDSSIVENCVDYDSLGRCRGCNIGYHLEADLCYINIGGCISYMKHLCLDCNGFNVLIENRCAGTCQAVSDTRSNFWYLERATMEAVSSQTGKVINTTIGGNGNTSVTGQTSTYPPFSDPNCASYAANGSCSKCSFRFFQNSRSVCESVSPLCQGFNQTNGQCTSCFGGFTLQNGQCAQ